MMPRGFESCRHVFVGCLVADDVKKGDNDVKTFVQTDFSDVALVKIQLSLLWFIFSFRNRERASISGLRSTPSIE